MPPKKRINPEAIEQKEYRVFNPENVKKAPFNTAVHRIMEADASRPKTMVPTYKWLIKQKTTWWTPIANMVNCEVFKDKKLIDKLTFYNKEQWKYTLKRLDAL